MNSLIQDIKNKIYKNSSSIKNNLSTIDDMMRYDNVKITFEDEPEIEIEELISRYKLKTAYSIDDDYYKPLDIEHNNINSSNVSSFIINDKSITLTRDEHYLTDNNTITLFNLPLDKFKLKYKLNGEIYEEEFYENKFLFNLYCITHKISISDENVDFELIDFYYNDKLLKDYTFSYAIDDIDITIYFYDNIYELDFMKFVLKCNIDGKETIINNFINYTTIMKFLDKSQNMSFHIDDAKNKQIEIKKLTLTYNNETFNVNTTLLTKGDNYILLELIIEY